MKRALRGLDAPSFRAFSEAACSQVLAHPAYAAARTLLLYCALPLEADPVHIAEHAVAHGKRVAYPYCEAGSDRRMIALAPNTPTDWEEGAFGIRTPVPAHSRRVPKDEIDLILVPGLAFDACGGRLGRGAGYYDRYLTNVSALLMGFCLDIQLIESVPADMHDVRMDAVVTNSTVFSRIS